MGKEEQTKEEKIACHQSWVGMKSYLNLTNKGISEITGNTKGSIDATTHKGATVSNWRKMVLWVFEAMLEEIRELRKVIKELKAKG